MVAWGFSLMGVLLLSGLALLAWGWRGRRVGDHPHCRACGFDLFGLVADAAQCPECGADVQRRLPVIGQRRRRRPAIIAGVVLLLLGGAMALPTAWQQTSKQKLYRHAPGFYLVWVIDDKDARQELAVRLQNGVLSGATARPLADAALDVQGDPARPWDDAWGGLIESAWAKNLLTAAQIERYIRQATPMMLQHRPRVQQGRKPALYLDMDSSDLRLGPGVALNVRVAIKAIVMDGRSEPLDLTRRSLAQSMEKDRVPPNNGWSGSSYHLLRESLDDPGEVSIVVEYERTVVASLSAQPAAAPVTLVDPGRATATFTVVAEPTGQYLTDPEAAGSAKAWFTEDDSQQRWIVVHLENASGRLYPEIWLVVNGQVIDVEKWDNASGTETAGHLRRHYHILDPEFAGVLDEAVAIDVIARPQFDRAETDAMTMPPVWLGEYRFTNVPVAPQGSTRASVHEPPPHNAVTAAAHPLTIERAHEPPTVQPHGAPGE